MASSLRLKVSGWRSVDDGVFDDVVTLVGSVENGRDDWSPDDL